MQGQLATSLAALDDLRKGFDSSPNAPPREGYKALQALRSARGIPIPGLWRRNLLRRRSGQVPPEGRTVLAGLAYVRADKLKCWQAESRRVGGFQDQADLLRCWAGELVGYRV